MKIAKIVHIPTPYRNPLYKQIAEQIGSKNLKVFYLDSTAKGAFKWQLEQDNGFQEKIMPKLSPDFMDDWPFIGRINPSIFSELNNFKPDVIIVHGYSHATFLMAFLWAKINKIPYVIGGEMEHLSLNKRQALARIVRDIIIKFVYSNAAYIMTMGTTGDKWCEHFGFPKEKLTRAPYVSDNEFFKENSILTPEDKKELRKKYNIPENNFVFISVSRLVAVKQLDKQIKAFNRLQEQYKNTTMFIVGNGEQEEYLKNLAKDNENIIFAGGLQKPDVARMLGVSDCFVLNSNYEPWGLVVNEALACSLPVISTDMVGSYLDLCKDGLNGYIVNAFNDNENELFKAMEKMVKAPMETIAEMRSCSNKIISTWGYKEAVEGYIESARKAIMF